MCGCMMTGRNRISTISSSTRLHRSINRLRPLVISSPPFYRRDATHRRRFWLWVCLRQLWKGKKRSHRRCGCEDSIARQRRCCGCRRDGTPNNGEAGWRIVTLKEGLCRAVGTLLCARVVEDVICTPITGRKSAVRHPGATGSQTVATKAC